jgi:lipoprotein-anchoring transpeptidase ErfK/SrfK
MGLIALEVDIDKQKMRVFDNDKLIKEYIISTGKKGVGEEAGSEQTPRGLHVIRAKFGGNRPANSVFVGRRATGEIYEPSLREKFPDRDWILTRILWLGGLEMKKNRGTMGRHIYIHGAPDDVVMGVPGSRGCVRMRNQDIIELFECVPVGTKILIKSGVEHCML